MTEYVFSTPYEFEGTEYKSIEVDLKSLKGSDITAAKRQFTNAGNYVGVPAVDPEFCAYILAKATKKPLEFFNEMPANDYYKITQMVCNFLLL